MRAARGFTLLEVVVVMVIIAAATVLGAMATTGGLDRMQVQSTAKQIAANLRYARAQALATGERRTFVLHVAEHRWQGVDERQGRIPEDVRVEFTGAREVQPRRDQGAIVFFPDGASTGGRVRLTQGRARWDVDVKWLTGEVSTSRKRGDAQ